MSPLKKAQKWISNLRYLAGNALFLDQKHLFSGVSHINVVFIEPYQINLTVGTKYSAKKPAGDWYAPVVFEVI